MQAVGRRDPIFRAIEAMTALTEILERRREVLARDARITIEQWRVLEEISTEHFIPSMFARSRDSSAAAVSKILRQLLDRDWTGRPQEPALQADREGQAGAGRVACVTPGGDRGDLDGIFARRAGRIQRVRGQAVRPDRRLFAREKRAARGGGPMNFN